MDQELPFKPIPAVVLVIFFAIFGVEIAFSLGEFNIFGAHGGAWREFAIRDYAFAPRVLELIRDGYWDWNLLLRFVSYPFVHGDFTHGLFAGVLWLALGKFATEAYKPWAVLLIFVASVVGGACVYGIYGLLMGANLPLIGAYPGAFGMIGAFTYVTWAQLGASGGNRLMAFRMIAVLMALEVIFSLLYGNRPTWTAEVGGFVIGGTLAIFLAPGGWSAFVARMRAR